MYGDSLELAAVVKTQPAHVVLLKAAQSAKEAWQARDYKALARIIRAMFQTRPEDVSREDIWRMLQQAGCPVHYVPVA
jgi:hypothetical protein